MTAVAALALLALGTASCGSANAASSGAGSKAAPVTLRLGYFPNVTHGAALVGVGEGVFTRDLAPDVLDASHTFNAGPEEIQAVLAGSIDVAFIGPSPAVTAYAHANGAVEIIAGAASGAAGLVPRARSPARPS